jgi:predicted naringenin-chalcone synthase
VAFDCFERLYAVEESPPDELIHVSCSGYLSPSPAQRYLAARRWCDTGVLHSYHMGCYGAFPPVTMALGLLASSHFALPRPKRRVDIVHTELLSMHADYTDAEPGSLVSMTLFADGFVRYSVTPTHELVARGEPGLEILATDTRLIADSADDMTWHPRADVFEMYLSKDVPLKLRDNIAPFMRELAAQAGIDFEREKSELLFAVHPGGPRILDHFRDVLGIEEAQQRWSRRVLFENGNMSSATVPHVWRELLCDPSVASGTRVVSVAFGPGLTATGMILRKT